MGQNVKKFELTERKQLVVETRDGITVCYLEDIFKPKDGDFVKLTHCDLKDNPALVIFKNTNIDDTLSAYAGVDYFDEIDLFEAKYGYSSMCLATDSERKQLIDKLASKGYEWDADKKEVVKLSDEFKYGDTCYMPSLYNKNFYVEHKWYNSDDNKISLNRGLVFKTPEEAIAKAKQMLGIE